MVIKAETNIPFVRCYCKLAFPAVLSMQCYVNKASFLDFTLSKLNC